MNTKFSNGYAFTDPLPTNLNEQIERIENNFASLIIIDGGVGQGKTTLAKHLADYIEGKPIDLEKQYVMGGRDFPEKLQICHDLKYKVIIYDESGDFNRRGALTQFNLMINRIFDTYRAFKIIVILVLPNFSVLDKEIFDKGIPRLLIHCYNRKKKIGNFTVYSLYRMFYIKHNMKKLVVTSNCYSTVTPNFRGGFYDLEEEERLELMKISIQGKKDIVNEAILKNKGLIDYYEICKRVNRSLVWVKNKIHELNINPERLYKRKKYFDTSVIDLLQKEKHRDK